MKILLMTLMITFFAFAKSGGVRKVSFIIGENGIYPESVSAFVGEELEIFVTSTTKKSCMMISGHQVFMNANKGSVSEAKIILSDSGRFKIYCPSDNFKASLTVIDNKRNRDIASIKNKAKPSVWVPRDYSE